MRGRTSGKGLTSRILPDPRLFLAIAFVNMGVFMAMGVKVRMGFAILMKMGV